MLTRLIVKNFKRFDEVEIELGDPVVFIGPNNSGKTSALQSLALWDIGLKRWNEKRKESKSPEKRPGVTINRRDLIAVPVPNASLLWKDLHVRKTERETGSDKTTKNIRIDIVVEGINEEQNKEWKCGLEFDYANIESFYCRPLRLSEEKNPERMPIPDAMGEIQIAYLPPMSGLSANETRLDPGAISVRIGEGRTAEVLRNLCYRIFMEDKDKWELLKGHIASFFGAELYEPKYIPERGEIELTYQEKGSQLDISSSGRGLQQTLLVLAYLYANKGSVLLIDEPDAHLEILRQRHMYSLLTEVSKHNGNQIIAASHSEVLLNEAAERDVVIAFVGKPHRINDRGSQVVKYLKEIGFEDYYLAEQKGWILYLEGSTDLAILKAFAARLGNEEAVQVLERPFVYYVANQPMKVYRHYRGLKEAVPQLLGIAVFDRLDQDRPPLSGVEFLTWRKREIENYLCFPETLVNYALSTASRDTLGPLFERPEQETRLTAMRESIHEISNALKTLREESPWEGELKVSDKFFNPVFESYYRKIGMPNIMAKKNYYILADFVPEDKIDPEVGKMLYSIIGISKKAQPAEP